MNSGKLSVFMAIQPSISHYREPLIDELLRSTKVEFHLFGSSPSSSSGDARNSAEPANAETLRRVATIRTRSVGSVRWQVGVSKTLRRSDFDAYVLEGNIYIVSTWVSLLIARLRGKPLFLWGHGWKRRESGLKLQARRLFYRLSSGLLLYGDGARDYALVTGIDSERLAVVYNSIYPAQVLDDASSDIADAKASKLRAELDPSSGILIVSCRLTPRHKVEALADAIDHIEDRALRPSIIIIGDGSERDALEQRFEQSGADAIFVGAEYDRRTLAAYFRMADLAVAPAAPGLNVIQALGFGVPVIAPAEDPTAGPELEAVVDGSTGARYALGDAQALSHTILEVLSDRDRLVEMGQSGLDLVKQRYTTERHAKAIEDSLLRWSEPDVTLDK